MTGERAGQPVTVLGAGIIGLWVAVTLSRRGYAVTLADRADDPIATSASSYAGAMLAPFCEAEAAPAEVQSYGRQAIQLWRDGYPDLRTCGTLVVAAQRDAGDLDRFARMTEGHLSCDAGRVAELVPALAGRFGRGLYYPEEAHLNPERAMRFLLREITQLGGEVRFGPAGAELAERVGGPSIPGAPAGDPGAEAFPQTPGAKPGRVIDCRGMGAAARLPGLRGVRGERVVLRAAGLSLPRPVRLLHPRHPLYVVPWDDDLVMVGATVVESEDTANISARALLELLGAAYALIPELAEAEVVSAGAALRPAFDDNVPRVLVPEEKGAPIHVNGAYRHGFLLAPVLAECCADVLEGRASRAPFVRRLDTGSTALPSGGEVI